MSSPKINILIASVLKPVNDVRLYHKIGKSILGQHPEARVHILGFQAKEIPDTAIQFYPIFNFQRLSWKRVFANFHFFQLLRKTKAHITIVSTWELLPAAIFFKTFFGGKLLYDVQENYFANILYTQVFPKLIRFPIALIVRMIELMSHPFISTYLLAEKCYQEELKFTRNKSLLLENKVSKEILKYKVPLEEREKYKIVYAGTVSKDYGIEEAIQFIKNLQALDTNFYLVIIGHYPQNESLRLLRQKTKDLDFIQLQVSNQPLPQHQILEEMASAGYILMPYQLNKSVRNRVPTKFYECMALNLPVITSKNEFWQEFARMHPTFKVLFWGWDSQEKSTKLAVRLLLLLHKVQKKEAQILDEDIFWDLPVISLNGSKEKSPPLSF